MAWDSEAACGAVKERNTVPPHWRVLPGWLGEQFSWLKCFPPLSPFPPFGRFGSWEAEQGMGCWLRPAANKFWASWALDLLTGGLVAGLGGAGQLGSFTPPPIPYYCTVGAFGGLQLAIQTVGLPQGCGWSLFNSVVILTGQQGAAILFLGSYSQYMRCLILTAILWCLISEHFEVSGLSGYLGVDDCCKVIVRSCLLGF